MKYHDEVKADQLQARIQAIRTDLAQKNNRLAELRKELKDLEVKPVSHEEVRMTLGIVISNLLRDTVHSTSDTLTEILNELAPAIDDVKVIQTAYTSNGPLGGKSTQIVFQVVDRNGVVHRAIANVYCDANTNQVGRHLFFGEQYF